MSHGRSMTEPIDLKHAGAARGGSATWPVLEARIGDHSELNDRSRAKGPAPDAMIQ